MLTTSASPIPDGLHFDVDRRAYDSIDAANQSAFKLLHDLTPEEARYKRENHESSEAMEFGTLVELLIQRPDDFERLYYVTDAGRRGSKAWDTAAFDAAGRTIIKRSAGEHCYELAMAIVRRANAHPFIGPLLAACAGRTQAVAVWHDPETGVRCKGMLDAVITWQGVTVVVDIKTTKDANPRRFASDCAAYGYHEQASFYLSGLDALAPVPRQYWIVALSKTPPYCHAIYTLSQDALKRGLERWNEHLRTYVACKAAGIWPGHPNLPQTLWLPRWEVQPTIIGE